jgi:hypothetical protein
VDSVRIGAQKEVTRPARNRRRPWRKGIEGATLPIGDRAGRGASTMENLIEEGFMAFTTEGHEGIGAVREISKKGVVIYVENGGEFFVPYSAIKAVHDQKVMLDASLLDRALLEAVGHAHDREDPKLVG